LVIQKKTRNFAHEFNQMPTIYHIPALLQATVAGLNIQSNGTYVDVTFGGGGHSRAIMQQLGPEGQLFSFDQDADAYRNVNAKENENENQNIFIGNPRWHFVHGNFRYLDNFMDYHGVKEIDGLIADLGVSFHHFDEAERGFSFRFAGPLDMRMNQKASLTAADLLAQYTEEQIAQVLYLYGELKNSRSIAKKIRGLSRMEELCTALNNDKKTLTLVCQALRMEVNDELGALREMLVAARELLKPGGRIAILTYHSLEDRIVKNFLRSGNVEGQINKDFYGNILTPFTVLEKGLTPSPEEIEANPRSRSAKLRVAEKR